MKELYQGRLELANRLWDEAKHRPVPGVEWVQAYATDMPHVLERVRELEAENEKLKREAEGLHAMIQQAIHPQSE